MDLRKHLEGQGCTFKSETDSEVIAHLLSQCYEDDLLHAAAAVCKKLKGTFGFAAICTDNPEAIAVARRGSPLVIGVGNEETLIASDVAAIAAYTKRVIFLDDDDLALITPDNIDIRNIQNVPVSREIAKIDWDVAAAEKNGYEHFMLKEIFEQPASVANTIRGRFDEAVVSSVLSGLDMTPAEIASISRIVIAACGTSMNAGMVGEYYFEDIAGIPAEVEQAAEFRYRNPIIEPQTLVLAISQSGGNCRYFSSGTRSQKQRWYCRCHKQCCRFHYCPGNRTRHLFARRTGNRRGFDKSLYLSGNRSAVNGLAVRQESPS